jgi:hypothetical protein
MRTKIKTLVIHPEDRSTDFLCPIYASIKNKTVIRSGYTKTEIIELIKSHDRIMMMGHGCPVGLFNCGRFKDIQSGCVIDMSMVRYLKDKDCVCIWCNADQFVNRHELKGFYSGMFISEVSEAYWYARIPKPSKKMVTKSNNKFSEILSKHINKKSKTIYNKVRQEYGILAKTNPVALYNNERLYLR